MTHRLRDRPVFGTAPVARIEERDHMIRRMASGRPRRRRPVHVQHACAGRKTQPVIHVSVSRKHPPDNGRSRSLCGPFQVHARPSPRKLSACVIHEYARLYQQRWRGQRLQGREA